MDTTDRQLHPLGLEPGWIYEAVVCTRVEGAPHAAPAGVRTTDGDTLWLDLFDTSRTLAAIATTGSFVVDFPRDATALFAALWTPRDLRFEPARRVASPRLADAVASVELEVGEMLPGDGLTHVRGRSVLVTVEPGLRLLNRAEALLLESLITASRAHLYGRGPTLQQLREHRRVVEKVAPGSAYATAMAGLLQEFEADS